MSLFSFLYISCNVLFFLLNKQSFVILILTFSFFRLSCFRFFSNWLRWNSSEFFRHSFSLLGSCLISFCLLNYCLIRFSNIKLLCLSYLNWFGFRFLIHNILIFGILLIICGFSRLSYLKFCRLRFFLIRRGWRRVKLIRLCCFRFQFLFRSCFILSLLKFCCSGLLFSGHEFHINFSFTLCLLNYCLFRVSLFSFLYIRYSVFRFFLLFYCV